VWNHGGQACASFGGGGILGHELEDGQGEELCEVEDEDVRVAQRVGRVRYEEGRCRRPVVVVGNSVCPHTGVVM
jgi:hypothetical protein